MASNVTSDVSAAVWTPEVVARVTSIVVIMAATLTGNAALIAGITCHAALRRRWRCAVDGSARSSSTWPSATCSSVS